MRIAIVTSQVPFVRGGAEVLVESLQRALVGAGHMVEVISIPFSWQPPEQILDHMLACRLLDISESNGVKTDLMIGLKFPAYLVQHPRKVLWLLHEHRCAYEFWDDPFGDLIPHANGPLIREAIQNADLQCFSSARGLYTISQNVSRRIKAGIGIDSHPLYPPVPNAASFWTAEAQEYLFYPSRIGVYKRQWLAIEALAHTELPVRLRFAGVPDTPSYGDELLRLAVKKGVAGRIEWCGRVSDEEMRKLYAECLGVVYVPSDEDYGYVTLEAMLSSKPVAACSDSGGPLEFIEPGKTGLVSEPTAESLARAMDELWRDREGSRSMGLAGRERFEALGIGWDKTLDVLCG